ncbi:MAG: M24 family metallopeptidase [Fimbriimonas sp.]|nr:M24 family metallopeptidase [Fimbriimonas sp.]
MSTSEVDVRRAKAARSWSLDSELVLICAGYPIGIPGGADQTFPYKPHPQYRWLTDRKREGGVLAFDPQDGWTLFEPALAEQELIWGGGDPPVGRSLEELDGWLAARKGRPLAALGANDGLYATDQELSLRLHIELDHARRPKDALEVDLLRRSAAATAAGYAAIAEYIRPGRSERQIQVEFEAAIARAGADGPGYATIVGAGPNSAVFHFTPGSRQVADGELVLVDAGAEVDGYVTDVTRTFPGGGSFSSDQAWLYGIVRESLDQATAACLVGAEWLDVHAVAARVMGSGLRDAGILKCSPEEALTSGAIGLFFPHGIGHMVGLGVRDAGGPLPNRNVIREVGGARIRMDLPLEAGYVVTIEPGLYFVPALLNDAKRRERFANQVNWAAVEPWIGGSGIRIEDNVLVTETGPIVLTDSIPK